MCVKYSYFLEDVHIMSDRFHTSYGRGGNVIRKNDSAESCQSLLLPRHEGESINKMNCAGLRKNKIFGGGGFGKLDNTTKEFSKIFIPQLF